MNNNPPIFDQSSYTTSVSEVGRPECVAITNISATTNVYQRHAFVNILLVTKYNNVEVMKYSKKWEWKFMPKRKTYVGQHFRTFDSGLRWNTHTRSHTKHLCDNFSSVVFSSNSNKRALNESCHSLLCDLFGLTHTLTITRDPAANGSHE